MNKFEIGNIIMRNGLIGIITKNIEPIDNMPGVTHYNIKVLVGDKSTTGFVVPSQFARESVLLEGEEATLMRVLFA